MNDIIQYFVSIVVISKDRHNFLIETIDSLKNLDYPKELYEIIVVEEGDSPLPIEGVKYIFLPRKDLGLGYARNTGVKNAYGEIIVFTDDDVFVDKNYLKEIVKLFSDSSVYGVSGLTLAKASTPFEYVQEILGIPGGGIKFLYWSKGKVSKAFGMSGCNMAFRRVVFNEFKFYEESFGRLGADDWLLSYEVMSRYKCLFNPNAVVYHKPRKNMYELIKTYYRRKICEYLIYLDYYHKSHFLFIFHNFFRSIILRTMFVLFGFIILGYKWLVYFIVFYYLFVLLSIFKMYLLIRNKKSFFIYPLVKLIAEIGILKAELVLLFKKRNIIYEIIKKYR